MSTLRVEACELHYSVRGSGAPVVLVQGVGVCGSAWAPQVDRLCSEYSCLAFDNRGMGASQPAGRDCSIRQMALDTLSLMDAQGWESAHLVGHSMGGLIGLEAALTAPMRVRSLSLLCTFARGRDATRLTWPLLSIGIRSRIGSRVARRRAFLELMAPPGSSGGNSDALAERIGSLFGHDLADQHPSVMKHLAAMRVHDVTARLGELGQIPTTVVSAQHDLIAPPSSGRAIAAGIPGARYVEIPNAAHGVPILDAPRINELLLEHLSAL